MSAVRVPAREVELKSSRREPNRGACWRLDGDRRDDDDCDNLCEDVSELEAHTRLQESNWELSEHQFDDDYDDGMEYDADA